MRHTVVKTTLAACFFYLVSAPSLATLAADASEPSAKMDPCSLITAAEARSLLGVEIAGPVSSDDGLMRHCTFSSSDKRNRLMLDAKTTDKAVFERFMRMHGSPVPKLGSDAYTNAGALLIWKNGTQVNIKIDDQSGKTSEDQKEAIDEKVANLVLQRL